MTGSRTLNFPSQRRVRVTSAILLHHLLTVWTLGFTPPQFPSRHVRKGSWVEHCSREWPGQQHGGYHEMEASGELYRPDPKAETWTPCRGN